MDGFIATLLIVIGIVVLGTGGNSYSCGYAKAQQDFLESPSVFADYAVTCRDKTAAEFRPNPHCTDSYVNEIISHGRFIRSK